jgi:hypothetical protein
MHATPRLSVWLSARPHRPARVKVAIFGEPRSSETQEFLAAIELDLCRVLPTGSQASKIVAPLDGILCCQRMRLSLSLKVRQHAAAAQCNLKTRDAIADSQPSSSTVRR